MEKNPISRPGSRPYQRTCGMMTGPSVMGRDGDGRQSYGGGQRSCGCPPREELHMGMEGKLPCAMAYVPDQKMEQVFDLGYGLQAGTIFPKLCKPFCGKRGGCR